MQIPWTETQESDGALSAELGYGFDRHGQGGTGTDPLDTAPMQIPWTETQESDGALSAELGYGFRLGNGSRNVWTPYVATCELRPRSTTTTAREAQDFA